MPKWYPTYFNSGFEAHIGTVRIRIISDVQKISCRGLALRDPITKRLDQIGVRRPTITELQSFLTTPEIGSMVFVYVPIYSVKSNEHFFYPAERRI